MSISPTAAIDALWTEVDGLRVFSRRSGPPSASDHLRDVVLVPGAVVSSRYMVPLMNELASDHRVHAPDLPGFGRSDHPPAALDVDGLAAALRAWMHAHRLQGALAVANSYGCQIVARALRREPTLFTRVVLQAPTYDRRARTLRATLWRWTWTSRREPRELRTIYLRDLRDCGLKHALTTYRLGLNDAIEDDLGQLHLPVLVVRGAHDVLVAQRWAEEVTDRLPDGQLIVLADTAHALPFSAAPQLAAITRGFFAASHRSARGDAKRA